MYIYCVSKADLNISENARNKQLINELYWTTIVNEQFIEVSICLQLLVIAIVIGWADYILFSVRG